MNSGKGVWKWAGAVLAVLCAAMGIAHVLLTRLDPDSLPADSALPAAISEVTPSADSQMSSGRADIAPAHRGSSSIERSEITSAALEDPREKIQDSGFKNDPPAGSATTRARFQDSSHKLEEGRAGVAVPAKAKSSEIKNTNAAADNPPSQSTQFIRPLGIVEKAGGRIQAVIQDGEWTRLVEEGEILADNTRVLRVSAEGVEVFRSNSAPSLEMARKSDAPAPGATAEIASADRESLPARDNRVAAEVPPREEVGRHRTSAGLSEADLPGIGIGEASYHAPAPRIVPAATAPRGGDPLPSFEAAPPAAPAPGAALGRIEHRDGRIQSVVTDGPWVKLVAEGSPRPMEPPGAPATPPVERALITPMPEVSPPAPTAARDSSPSSYQNSPIPNSVEPIGFAEWQDGHTLTVLSSGSSIDLVDSSVALELARRRLAALPAEGRGRTDFPALAGERPARRDENESTWLGLPLEMSATRGPPEDDESPPAPPEEIARGQPEDEMLADASRAPPDGDAGENEWSADLPGIESSTAARIEPRGSIEYLPDALRGTPQEAPAESVSKIRLESGETPQSGSITSPNPSIPIDSRAVVIGTVRWTDGVERFVISRDSSIQIVDAEEWKGIQASEQGASDHISSGLSASGEPAGHPESVGAHPTIGKSSGPGLPSGPRIRDNQSQSRR